MPGALWKDPQMLEERNPLPAPQGDRAARIWPAVRITGAAGPGYAVGQSPSTGCLGTAHRLWQPSLRSNVTLTLLRTQLAPLGRCRALQRLDRRWRAQICSSAWKGGGCPITTCAKGCFKGYASYGRTAMPQPVLIPARISPMGGTSTCPVQLRQPYAHAI